MLVFGQWEKAQVHSHTGTICRLHTGWLTMGDPGIEPTTFHKFVLNDGKEDDETAYPLSVTQF